MKIHNLLRKNGSSKVFVIKKKFTRNYYKYLDTINKLISKTNFIPFDGTPNTLKIIQRLSAFKLKLKSWPICDNKECNNKVLFRNDIHFTKYCSYDCAYGKGNRSGLFDGVRKQFLEDINKYQTLQTTAKEFDAICKENLHNDFRPLTFKCTQCADNFIINKGNLLNIIKDEQLQERVTSCPTCVPIRGSQNTAPIRKISRILDKNNVSCILEKKFEGCKNKQCLPFDFYLPDYNLLVEYDGKHHVENIYGDKNFKATLKNDKIKNDFAFNNNIPLLRIPHTDPHPDATVLKHIGRYNKFFYTFDMLEEDMKLITEYVDIHFKDQDFEIYCIYKGALLMGTMLAERYNKELGIIKYQRYDGKDTKVEIINKIDSAKNILLVDDLIETGYTMKKGIKKLQRLHKGCFVLPITIFGRNIDLGIDYKFIKDHPNKWISFPWELNLNKEASE